MRWLVPLNSTSLPWWAILSIMTEASLSSPRTVLYLKKRFRKRLSTSGNERQPDTYSIRAVKSERDSRPRGCRALAPHLAAPSCLTPKRRSVSRAERPLSRCAGTSSIVSFGYTILIPFREVSQDFECASIQPKACSTKCQFHP